MANIDIICYNLFMSVNLSGLTGSAPVIALLGMCKNAGKTTALNRLISEYRSCGRSLAVTSVGRDGERVDLVTGTEKPPIYMHEGMLAATASKLLPLSDISREILDVTDVATPLGRVVVFKARSGGYVQLAGPSAVSEMSRLRKQLNSLGARTVLIDGALNRRSPAAGAVDGACVLCAGASLNSDMSIVVSETAFVCRVLTLPELDECQWDTARRYTAFGNGSTESADTVEQLCIILKRINAERVTFSGALTETAVLAITQCGVRLDGLIFIVEDSSRILIKKETFERIMASGADFKVRRGTTLAAVTVNPVSAGGWRFDADRFLDEMRRAAPVPVVDVERL